MTETEDNNTTTTTTTTTVATITANVTDPAVALDLEIKAQAIAAINEPPAKRARSGWEDLTLNINHALVMEAKGCYFSTLVESEVNVLKGVDDHPLHADILSKELECPTIADLARYKFYHMAKMIATLADFEVAEGRPTNSVMNLDNALTKEYEHSSLREIADAPIDALQGLSEDAAKSFKALGVETVRDLGTFKYCRLAEAIVEATKYEEILTEKERKVERELKKLA
jgi:hypothetical protein